MSRVALCSYSSSFCSLWAVQSGSLQRSASAGAGSSNMGCSSWLLLKREAEIPEQLAYLFRRSPKLFRPVISHPSGRTR